MSFQELNRKFYSNQDSRNYAYAVNQRFKDSTGQTPHHKEYHTLLKALNTRDDSYVAGRFIEPDFDRKMKAAYASPKGYVVTRNKQTGETEMFVAGTRTTDQWVGNAYDALSMSLENSVKSEFDKLTREVGILQSWSDKLYTPYNKSLLYRKTRGAKEDEIARVARENNVDIVYGHSRGAALVADSDMDPSIKKVGVDGAMLISNNKDMLNYYEGGSPGFTNNFDAIIGHGGTQNVTMNLGSHVHHVWD